MSRKQQFIEEKSKPQTEMQVRKKALFGSSDHQDTPINEVVPSGHLDSEELEVLHMYHDLYGTFQFLRDKFGLPETQLESKLLERIAVVPHFSKAEKGFASEMLITSKSQQFQAMKQKRELDSGPGLGDKISQAIDSRSDNAGKEIGSPDPEW